MKKLMIGVLLFLTLTAEAQSFEGTIQWAMKMDDANQAKMADAQNKMNDPATQAKIKEMQAKMNDPQMKAVMDANPQMKAQLEAALKMAQGGSGNSMIPKGFTIAMKDQNVITKMDIGGMAMEILYLNDKNQSYHIDRQNKTYSAMPAGRGGPSGSGSSAAPKVTKTSETTKILNYNCTKYLVEIQEGSHAMTQSIWTTTDIRDIDLKSLSKQKMARGQSFFYEGMDGVPLRIESAAPQGKVTMEVVDIKRGGLNSADFILPADFKEMPGTFGGWLR